MSLIIPGGSGDPRLQAARNPYHADAHGLTASQIEALNAKYESFLPKLVTTDPEYQRSKILEEDFRKIGATRAPFRKLGFGGQYIPGGSNMGQGTLVSAQTPYQPEFSSQDRQQYPVHRILANRYWRLFHKLDPVVGNCIDLYSEVPWSPYQLTGEGLDGEIKDHFECMCEQLELLALLPHMTREYLVVGEVFPHCFYDSDKHMWDYVTAHNPDQIEIVDAPFIRMDPIIELIPDQRLRAILSSGDPNLQKIREQMPSELLGRLLARQNIPLDNLNCGFLPRKLHPYDVRGTSILSRLWRVFMLEDAVFAATIATARRHAGPIKIAKLGNPQTGWIPGPEHEARLLELLAQAELDPHAFLVYHFGVQFEAFGTTDRVISVGREWETLERIKLVGLGVSKSFLHGEVTYASAATGLQVFLQRLLTMRNWFETKWIYKKLFKPISEINEFIKPSKAEVSHRIRIRRTAKELNEDNRYIIPELVWDKPLDPNVDRDLISAAESLTRIGVKFSKKTLMSFINRKFEDELKASLEEEATEAKERQKYQKQLGPAGQGPTGTQPSPMTVEQFDQSTGKSPPGQLPPGPGQPGGPPALQPPPRPGSLPALPAASAASTAMPQEAEAPIRRTPMRGDPPKKPKSDDWRQGDLGNWDVGEVETILELFRTGQTDDPFWAQAATGEFKSYIAADDYQSAWDDFVLYLQQFGFPDEDIEKLSKIMAREDVIPRSDLDGMFESMPEDIDSDAAAEAAFLAAFRKDKRGNGSSRFSTSALLGDGHGGGGTARRPFRRY